MPGRVADIRRADLGDPEARPNRGGRWRPAGGTIALDPADVEVDVPANRKPYFVHNGTAGGFAVALRNPDAEAGDTSGWTTTGTWETETAEGNIIGAHGRTWYFSATGVTNPAILEQIVDLTAQGLTAAERMAVPPSTPASSQRASTSPTPVS